MTPRQASAALRRISAGIDAADVPDPAKVRRELNRLLAAFKCREPGAEDIEDDKGSTEGPEEIVSVNVPKKVDDLVKEVKEGNPEYTDAQAWGTAWSIYCKSVNPDSPHCKQSEY